MHPSTTNERISQDEDVQILFSKARMSNATYIEFSKPSFQASSLHALAVKEPVAPTAAESAMSEPVAQRIPPARDESAPSSTTSWHALDRILGGRVAESGLPRTWPCAKIALFSLAGGVGKTTLASGLARALSLRGERVALVDCAPFGTLAHHFGLSTQRPAVSSLFIPPVAGGGVPISVLATPMLEHFGADRAEWPARIDAGSSFILMDSPAGINPMAELVLRKSTYALIPIAPDVHSLSSISSLNAFLTSSGNGVRPLFVLNRFVPNRPLHRDIRSRLEQILGERLLPILVREDHAVTDAAAMGVPVFDHAPRCAAAEDMQAVSDYLQKLVSHEADTKWAETA